LGQQGREGALFQRYGDLSDLPLRSYEVFRHRHYRYRLVMKSDDLKKIDLQFPY